MLAYASLSAQQLQSKRSMSASSPSDDESNRELITIQRQVGEDIVLELCTRTSCITGQV